MIGGEGIAIEEIGGSEETTVYNPVSRIQTTAVLASPPLVDLRLGILSDDLDAILWDDGDAILWE